MYFFSQIVKYYLMCHLNYVFIQYIMLVSFILNLFRGKNNVLCGVYYIDSFISLLILGWNVMFYGVHPANLWINSIFIAFLYLILISFILFYLFIALWLICRE